MDNKTALIVRIAKRSLKAMEFPTQKALEKYLEKHKEADRSKHHVNAPAYSPKREKRNDPSKLTDDELHARSKQPALKSDKKKLQEEIKRRRDRGEYKPTDAVEHHSIGVFKNKPGNR